MLLSAIPKTDHPCWLDDNWRGDTLRMEQARLRLSARQVAAQLHVETGTVNQWRRSDNRHIPMLALATFLYQNAETVNAE